MEKIKDQFTGRRFMGGAYATVISVVVIAVVIAINLLVGELNISKDMTAEAKYSLTDGTRDFVEKITDDITVYYLTPNGSELGYYDVDLFAEQFNAVNSHVQITSKDPVKYPKFTAQYTDESVSEYSFIVVDETSGRSRYIDTYDYVLTEFDYNTYSYSVTGIDLEGQLVSALQYVTTDVLPKMYYVTGHGEMSITTALASGIAKENVTREDIVLLTAGEIPDDCDILFIYNPERDYTADEAQIVKDYLINGGRVLAVLGTVTPQLPNLCSILSYYGLSLTPNEVIEGNSRYYAMRSNVYLVPDIESHDITTGLSGNTYAFCPNSLGIMLRDGARSTITYNPLLITSDSAYSKEEIVDTYEKEKGDYEGPFYIGLEATEEYDGVSSTLIVYSCTYFLDDSLISYNTYANGDIFYNTLNCLADIDTSVSARAVSLVDQSVSLTEAEANAYGLLYVFIIPIAVIGIGIFVTVRRRHL